MPAAVLPTLLVLLMRLLDQALPVLLLKPRLLRKVILAPPPPLLLAAVQLGTQPAPNRSAPLPQVCERMLGRASS